jgi:hypothetical protein
VTIGATGRHAIERIVGGVQLIEQPDAARDEHDDKNDRCDVRAVPALVFGGPIRVRHSLTPNGALTAFSVRKWLGSSD